jgi:hypothetical protein
MVINNYRRAEIIRLHDEASQAMKHTYMHLDVQYFHFQIVLSSVVVEVQRKPLRLLSLGLTHWSHDVRT